MSKDTPEAKEARIGWIVAAIALLGGAAVAFGFSTPGARLAKVETTVSEHETRIQKLEDMGETLESIASAVGAEKPKRRRNR